MSIVNRLAFACRQSLRWRRGAYDEPSESKDGLFADRGDPSHWETLEAGLVDRYDLSAFRLSSSRLRYLETLTYLHFLDVMLEGTCLPAPPGVPLRWLDAGAKNWAYVEAIAAVCRRQAMPYELVGVELDGYRVYRDFHSRRDYAETFIRNLPEAQYVVGDVMTCKGPCDVISSFLPFVFRGPALAWGLPADYFRPLDYLRHLVSILAPGGLLLILNQGAEESREQERLLARVPGIAYESLGEMPPSFLEYRYPRYAWRIRKEDG